MEPTRTSAAQVQLHVPTRALHRPQGILSPPHAATQQSRQPDAASCASVVKVALYLWAVLAIVLGLAIACLVLYLTYFKEGGDLAPPLPFSMAAYAGVGLALASGLGLYGLQRQRKCVTDGRRNYALGLFVSLGLFAAIVLLVAGAMALSLVQVVEQAEQFAFSQERVMYLEKTVVQRLNTQVEKSSSGWKETQDRLQCCGYESVASFQTPPWDSSLLEAVEKVNGVAGDYCTADSSLCSSTEDSRCPIANYDWCRVELLNVLRANYTLLGACAVALGSGQVLGSGFALFTLLCDVRRLRFRSPVIEIPHRALSPVQPKNS